MPRTIQTTVYSLQELIEIETRAKSKDKPVKQKGKLLPKRTLKQASAAVERAKDWFRDMPTDYEWWDYTYEVWGDALDQIGFTGADIYFRGFSSQGDGASFTSSVDIDRLVDFLMTPIEPDKCISGVGGHKTRLLHGHSEDFRPWLVHKINGKYVSPEYRFIRWAANNLIAKVSRDRYGGSYVHEHTCTFKIEIDGRSHSQLNRLSKLVDEFEKECEQLRLDLSRAIYRDLEADYNYLTSDEGIMDFVESAEETFTIDGRRFG